MQVGARAFWLMTAVVLFIASVGALSLLASTTVVPSAIRDPLSAFAWPGVTAWWFAFGALFQTVPSSPSGIAFAAIANAALWSLLGFALAEVLRRLPRFLVARRP
jgi:hypothetical protein